MGKKIGRKRGRRTKGYFFRAGRGWYSKDRSRFIPLRFEDGEHIKDKDVDERLVQEAHARFLLKKTAEPEVVNQTTILDVCLAYLKYAEKNGATKTHFDRCDTLFDLCFGLPPEFRSKDGTTPKGTKKEREAKRFHKGFGKRTVNAF